MVDRVLFKCGLASLGAFLMSCSPQTSTEPAPSASSGQGSAQENGQSQGEVHPVSGLAVIPLKVTTKDGPFTFRVEVADTIESQARGLMFRTKMGGNEGMIFPYDTAEPRSFWMKNTPLPLDIIFIGADNRIANIHAMTTPYSLDSVASDGPSQTVLELNGGRAAELGIGPGDLVEF
jgi:uncharacterized membrane protein (UPF0127 family)